jgi:hypothetical protein
MAPVAAVAAAQSLPDSQLEMFIRNTPFPVQCGEAQMASAQMRVKSTTDPATLHKMTQAYVACAKTPYAANNGALFNSAIFAATAASLLAARHQTGAAALADAQNALKGASLIQGYSRGTTPHGGAQASQNTPSMLLTNAGRMGNDAKAIIASLQGTTAGAPAVAFPATPVPGQGSGH